MQYITSGGLKFKVNNFESLFLSVNGNAGIGTPTPGSYKLYVAGSAYSTGGWVSSDQRFKENIAVIESPLEKVRNIRGVVYTWKREQYKDKGFPEGRHFGVIAQEVEQVLPEVVKEGPEGEKAVAYTELVPILVEAIKEQQQMINALVGTLKEHGIHVDINPKTSNPQQIENSDKLLKDASAEAIPEEYGLFQNHPNPFNPSTTLKYALPKAGHVTIKIYNTLGQHLRTLVDADKTAGYHTIQWDGKNQAGELVASGTYIFQMQSGDFLQSRKMLFMK
jgi:hypothetical protein